jgi:hypothetical protein
MTEIGNRYMAKRGFIGWLKFAFLFFLGIGKRWDWHNSIKKGG